MTSPFILPLRTQFDRAYEIEDADGNYVASCSQPDRSYTGRIEDQVRLLREAEAAAADLVRRVNALDELTERLESMLRLVDDFPMAIAAALQPRLVAALACLRQTDETVGVER